MAKLSAILPSRDERFLIPTIHDLFRNARGEFEVIAVLDSDKWPEGWKEVTDQYPNLHTIHNGTSKGMRHSINVGVASAVSRGAKFIMKSDGHCAFSEGFDEVLKAECEPNWVVVPRRGRLDPENWVATETNKPDIDYHYLSFPDNPSDWGGKGLNGKPWPERAVERKDVLLDDEMSSQGSCWFMYASYFNELELMDEGRWGPFWSEFQEIGLKCWLSGGQVKVNKKAKYLHLHKGTKYGRGYRLEESALKKGRNEAMKWPWNESWPKQALPFSWLIEHFWPVPSWPDNWEEILYATRKPRVVAGVSAAVLRDGAGDSMLDNNVGVQVGGLKIHSAVYGVSGNLSVLRIDVAQRVRELVKDNSLDIVVNNSTLTPNQNPFRGKKKRLLVRYSFDGGEVIDVARDEKDWLIIGPVWDSNVGGFVEGGVSEMRVVIPATAFDDHVAAVLEPVGVTVKPPTTAPALNDYLIRRFSISPQRLRGPMPIELRDFHRDDLAQLFAELGFKRMVEVGVAEGNYSEILLKANPEAELILVDPWGDVEGNAQNKGSNRHKFAYEETKRKTAPYPNVRMLKNTSMGVVGGFKDGWFDAAYLDANHSYPFIMEDLINWTRKVRSGGMVAIDDVFKLDEARWGAGPMEAVYDYTRAMRINPWWLIAAHKSVDAFFVKL